MYMMDVASISCILLYGDEGCNFLDVFEKGG
jgi:hypothetical protein